MIAKTYFTPRSQRHGSAAQHLIESLDMATSLQYAEAYLHFAAEARPLMEVLALAISKTHDNPHHHKITCTALEEYTLSTSPRGSELLLMASAHLSAARCLRDCYELYAKYFPGWVRCMPCEGEASSPCRRTSIDCLIGCG